MKKIILVTSLFTLTGSAFAIPEGFQHFKTQNVANYAGNWINGYETLPAQVSPNYLPFNNLEFSNTDMFYWKPSVSNTNYAYANDQYYPLDRQHSFLFNKKGKVGVIDASFAEDLHLLTGGQVYHKWYQNNYSNIKIAKEDNHANIVIGEMTALSYEKKREIGPLALSTVFLYGYDKTEPTIREKYVLSSNDFKTLVEKEGVTIWNNSFSNYFLVNDQGISELTKYGTSAYNKTYNTQIAKYRAMAEYIRNHDVLFIFASGNEGQAQPSPNVLFPLEMDKRNNTYGDVIDGMLSVGAYDTKTNNLWESSNQCGKAKDYCLVADMSSSIPDTSKKLYYFLNGTSAAAPKVTSLAVTLKSLYPYLTNKQIKMAILTTATDIGKAGVDEKFGWGLLNFDRALKQQAVFSLNTVFDLSYNKDKAKENTIYNFGNELSGKGIITIKNATKGEIVNFNGSGVNSGVLKIQNATVNIDGQYKQMPIKNDGILYASGNVKSLINSGNFYNYSYFAKDLDNKFKTPALFEGDLVLESVGKVYTSILSPIRVKGTATLSGSIYIDGDLPNDLNEVKILIAEKGIKGQFSNLRVISYANKYDVIYNAKDITLRKRP